jgi:UDP-N-acetylmuramate dehydrogenase
LVQVSTEAEIIAAIEEAGDCTSPDHGRWNQCVLIADKGFDGISYSYLKQLLLQSEVDACSGATLTIGAGEDWDTFVADNY